MKNYKQKFIRKFGGEAAEPESKSVTPAMQDKALWVTILVPLITPITVWIYNKTGVHIDPLDVISFVGGSVIPAIFYVIQHKQKSGAIILAETERDKAIQVAKIQAQAQQSPEAAAEAANKLVPPEVATK